MVLVDTSVWIAHFRDGNVGLPFLLDRGEVACHPFILGELACGNLRRRSEILSLISSLPMVVAAEHEEVLFLLEEHKLMGKGLGYVDAHLLAAAILAELPIWTFDKNLGEASRKFDLFFQCKG